MGNAVGPARWAGDLVAWPGRIVIHPHKIETLAVGAGPLRLTIQPWTPSSNLKKRQARMREIKRLMKTALEALKGQGFIVSYEISPQGLVSVVRAG